MPKKCRLSFAEYVLWPDPACRPCIASGGNFYANPEGSLCLFPADVPPTDRTFNRWVLSPDVDACGKAFDRPATLFEPSTPRPPGWSPDPSSPPSPQPQFSTGSPVPDWTTPNPHEEASAGMPALAIVCLLTAGKIGPFFKIFIFSY